MQKELTKIKPCEHPCPFRTVMDRLGDKWSVLIILLLQDEGTLRFGEMLGRIDGISLKVLSSCLKKLEKDKLITRKAYPEVPPRVEYTLTQSGHGLVPYIRQLSEWSQKNLK
ncbi:MAG: helix-turn-helix transcriptional regulator [Prevotella sp.]|nr:helix-turn-helix domain-containing protein [Prevotella sp.]MCH3994827.1 helix-turn-helix transcriptional regulator [Prevotella sp.]